MLTKQLKEFSETNCMQVILCAFKRLIRLLKLDIEMSSLSHVPFIKYDVPMAPILSYPQGLKDDNIVSSVIFVRSLMITYPFSFDQYHEFNFCPLIKTINLIFLLKYQSARYLEVVLCRTPTTKIPTLFNLILLFFFILWSWHPLREKMYQVLHLGCASLLLM